MSPMSMTASAPNTPSRAPLNWASVVRMRPVPSSIRSGYRRRRWSGRQGRSNDRTSSSCRKDHCNEARWPCWNSAEDLWQSQCSILKRGFDALHVRIGEPEVVADLVYQNVANEMAEG